MLPPLKALVAFEAVARLGSIGAAARELHVTQAAVSQQLKGLESFLDTQLFERNKRGVTLTQSAQQYLPVVAGSLQHLRLQTQILFGAQQDDVLSIKVNHSICHNWLLPKLTDFTYRFPFIRLDLSLVDWPSTTPCTDADVELTNGYVESEFTRNERLFQETWLLVCSPEFYLANEVALTQQKFEGMPAVQVKGYEESWMQWLSHNGVRPSLPNVQLEVSNSLHGLQAVKHGMGIMLVRSLVAQKSLDAGELVLASTALMPTDSAHYLITHHKRNAKVNFFCDWLSSQIQQPKTL